MPKLTLWDSTSTPIPDLSLQSETIEFLDRIFGAHGGYRPDEKISQVLQTGGFYEPKYNTSK